MDRDTSNFMSSKKLFNPVFAKKPFKAYTDRKFYVGRNPAKEVKRALKEIAESVHKPVLAYSGGMDSGFVLRCLADLKQNENFDKIPVYIGDFRSKDMDRAVKYAADIGIELNVVGFRASTKDLMFDMDIAYHISDTYLIKDPISIFQECFRRKLDATVIKSVCIFGENVFPKIMDRYRMTCHKFIHHLPGSNTVDVFDWDIDTFCSMITPFLIQRANIDVSPFSEKELENLYNPYNPYSYNSSLFKYMTYLSEYPDLFQIFFKFPTIRKQHYTPEMLEFMEYQKQRDVDYEFGWININGIDLEESNVRKLIDDPNNLL